MTTKLIPLHGRVFVRPAPAEQERNGLIIPKSASDMPQSGTVVACPDNGVVEMGDTVLYQRGAGKKSRVDGEELLVLEETDLMAVIEP